MILDIFAKKKLDDQSDLNKKLTYFELYFKIKFIPLLYKL